MGFQHVLYFLCSLCVMSSDNAVRNSLIAGSAAGIASILVVHPLDTIRTRLQTNPQFKGALDCARTTVQKEGFTALYRGMAFPLAAQGVYKAVMFSSYTRAQQSIRRIYGNQEGPLSLGQLAVCGAAAGTVNSFVVTPVELVRNRLMVQYGTDAAQNTYRGPLHAVSSIVRSNGILGMWRGLLPTVLRDAPGVASFYAGNEFMTRTLAVYQNSLNASTRAILSGMFAGICFWTVALPLDTVKTMVQTDLTHQGTYTLIRNRLKQQGFSSLFRGWSVAYSRGIPSAAIIFYTFHLVNNYLNGKSI